MLPESALAFLALPVKDAGSEQLADELAHALQEHGLEPFLPTKIAAGDTVPEAIQSALRRSSVVIADITGRNPNVLFELGVAIGLRKPVLLLSQGSLDDVPPDLRALQIAVYRPTDLSTVSRYVRLW